MMKKIFASILLLFAGFTALTAQSADKFTGALLWKISGNGLESPSYVLGTYHLFTKDFTDSIPGLRDAMSAADRIVGELDLMNNMADIQMDLALASMMPEGVTYKTLLSDKEYSRLEMVLKDMLGMNAEEWGIYKPAMVSLLVATVVYMKSNPNLDRESLASVIDLYIQQEMAAAGKEVVGLETPDEQIYALFDAEPLRVQAKDLLCSVLNLDYMGKQQENILKYYRSAELGKLYDIALNDPENPCPPTEIYKNTLLGDRNSRWLDKLPAIMAGGSSLIAVGALHLAGQEGLLFRLDEMGYTVSPVLP